MSDEKDEKLENEAETPETEAAEEAKPKPKRARRRKAAEPKAEADAPEEKADEPKEEKPKRRRRGSAETTTTAKRDTTAAPRDASGKVAVRAQARYVRCAPRKARLVVDHIRGKSVEDARAILATTPRAVARDVLKLLDSAIANAENNHELVADELKVGKAFVDEGPTIKRFRPRAQGRATRIRKRTSHMTILLTTKEDA
jgi:ribosomal protein L22